MFRDKMTDQQAKYALRKKKNGGGAASFLIGTVVVGGLMLGGTINASANDATATTDGSATKESTTGEPANSGNEVTLTQAAPKESTAENTATGTPVESNSGSTATSQSTATPQSTAATLMAEAATKDHLANNKISISNVRVNKSEVVESQGLDITFSFDWTGQGLEKGDMLVTPLTDGFTSITRQVETPFGANGQQMGIMVLDYDAKQIVTKFTADMDPNKIYSGTINIATFVDRDYFKNVKNSVDLPVTLADGKTAQVKFDVIFDALQQNPDLEILSLYAKESKDNADQSTDIKWADVVNKAQNEMTDAIIYLSPDHITGVDPQYDTPKNRQTAWTTLGIEYNENQTYVIDPATIKVYKATVYDSMGYAKQQELKEGSDYKITHSELNPHDYTVELLGDYATTKDQFVIEYGGNVKNSVGDRTQVNHTTSDSLVAYYTGRVLYGQGMDKYYAGPLNMTWVTADITVNNSSIDGVTDEDLTGSVTVVHIDASTGNILKKEAYVVGADGTLLKNAKQGTPYATEPEDFPGFKYTTMGYNSDPKSGEVKQGLQRVIYLYMPEATKTGSVDVTYIAEDGTVLEKTSDVVKDGELGSDYTTTEKEFDGYHFVRMGEFSADATGQVAEGTKHVVYVYAKNPEKPVEKKGSVDVKYITKDGQVLEDVSSVKDNAPVGEDYTTEEKSFDGYH
ncbi:MucBP domain-containing protein, partial [Limosilactobacillus ingluviei]|uniref:MucBP domain-containing protein n=1 Tax=Limosilactobacillus ingluviei TaxID=148604 RepID=UPI0024BBCCB8